MSLEVTLVIEEQEENEYLYSANITHNLNKMAAEAGIYQHLWRPEELNIQFASELIIPLSEGLQRLKDDPERFKQFNAKNGWGMYKHFVPFVEKYLKACVEFPETRIDISR